MQTNLTNPARLVYVGLLCIVYVGLLCMLCLVVSLRHTLLARAASIDFNGLAVGTKLDKQIDGIVFLRYQGRVGGVVAESPTGRVAAFNDSGGCEFCASGANIAFSQLHRTITLHVGLLPIQGLTLQRDLRLTAFDPAGAVRAIATANVTAGAGFGTTLVVTTATPEIATVVLEAINDPEMLASIAVNDITFDDAPKGAADFALQLPPGVSVLQDGPAVDVPITLRRFGPSSGTISFSLSDPPAGVSATITPNPAPATSAVLHLKATSGPVPEMKTLVITGSPVIPSVGPSPRSASIDLTTTAKLRLTGPADFDLASCAPDVAHGVVAREYWVVRDYRVSGPIKVALQGLPANVTGTVTPEKLDFPGWVIGQRVSARLNTIAGTTVPDTWMQLHLTGPGVDVSFPILVYGSCPRENRNFVIRGRFGYLNDQTVEPNFHPLNGAQVEIFRHRSDWYDDRVGEAYTDAQGNFSVDLYASTEGDYYARLRLFSPEVQLKDAENSSVWSIDTEHKSNRGGLIEVGTVTISRDGGTGTPRAAVWQGFRDAALEFQCTVGQPVPGGSFDVEVWRGSGPVTFYDEIHWKNGFPTGESWNPYRITTHEFAHVFRDVLDGNEAHWHADDWLYVYGRNHDGCTGPDAFGFSAHESGFAFHEGWAEYWSRDVRCCPNAIGNQDIEGTVAWDLNNLAACAGAHVLPNNPDCPEVRRRGMVEVLALDSNLIHSDFEFRRAYERRFPGCLPLGSISDGCVGAAGGALSVAPPGLAGHVALDRAEQRNHLIAAIEAREHVVAEFQEQQRSSTGLRAFALRAAAEEGTLVVNRMRDELAELDRGDPPESYLQRAPLERRRRIEFVAHRKAIQLRALRGALYVVPPEQRPEVERRLRLLQESRIDDASLESIISMPAMVGDDAIDKGAASHSRWLLWAALALTFMLVVAGLFVVFLRRKTR